MRALDVDGRRHVAMLDFADRLAQSALLLLQIINILAPLVFKRTFNALKFRFGFADMFDDVFDRFHEAAAHLHTEGEAAYTLRHLNQLMGVLTTHALEFLGRLRLVL